MNKLTSLLLPGAVALGVALTGGLARADRAQMQQLLPDTNRPRLTDKTYIFSRSQLKYGLQRTNYLSRWVDQPLFIDPALEDGENNSLTQPGFNRMAQVARQYGLDGFAFFPQTSGRYLAYGYAEKANVPGFHLLNEITSGEWRIEKEKVVELALKSPQSLRINGKLVFTSYRADAKPVEYWQKMLGEFRKQYGDQFIFIPDVGRWAGQSMGAWREKYHANTVTAQDIKEIKEYLRKWISATDGLYFAAAASFQNSDHTFDGDAYRNFLVPVMQSVLAEPQFKNKYFGLSAVVGHENNTRLGVTLSSDATKSLRQSMDAALDAQPDIIVIPEWDEQNENTSLRPTVYNGLSSLRIMRYYTAKLHNEKLSPLPDDNQQIPNLILSYRKLLVTGEPLELELLNVPDTEQSTPYTARLTLEDVNGKTVHTFAPQSFDGNKLRDHTLTVPSETLSQYEVLRPRLEIESAGRQTVFEDGLHYIDLRSTWNWDYKWIKQPLRDQLNAGQAVFEVSAPRADGTRLATAAFETDEPLARVQLLDNDDVIYEYSPAPGWREDENRIVLSIEWESLQTRREGLKLKGGITLQNASGEWSEPGGFRNTKADAKTDATTFSFDGQIAYTAPQRVFLAVPKAQAEKATLAIQLPGIYEGTIPVRDIVEKSLYGIPGPHSFNLVISRYLRQDKMLPLLKTQSVQFSVPVLPDLPNSVLHLQAIGVSGHMYRSRPVALAEGSDQNETLTVFSSTRNAPVQVPVQKRRAPEINYLFNPRYGSVLMTDAGRPFWGVLGGHFGLATARGGDDATPFIRFEEPFYPKGVVQSAPVWTKLDNGEYSLRFAGKGAYIALPQGVIPRRAAVTIEMDIKPDDTTGQQMIIANRHYYPGSLSVYTEDGVLKADYGSRFGVSRTGLDSGLKLPAGQWSHLTIRYDLQNIVFEVNGQASKKLPAEGPGLYDTASVVGGFGDNWFQGEIKSLRIAHGS